MATARSSRKGKSSRPRGWLDLGTRVDNGRPRYVAPEAFRYGTQIVGPTGCGKSRKQLSIYRQVLARPNAAIIVFSGKGDFGPMCRDAAIAAGEAKRLLMFDLADPDVSVGWTPFAEDDAWPMRQVKGARESFIRSASRVRDLTQMAQLNRFTLISFAAAYEAGLTIVDVPELLTPNAALRRVVVGRLSHLPHLQKALAYLDSLPERRQEELTASLRARLESVTLDPTIRRVFSRRKDALNLRQVIRDPDILIVNLVRGELRAEDQKLLGRMMLTGLSDAVYAEAARGSRREVWIFLDEAQLWLVHDLIDLLDQGRELLAHIVVSHHYPEQLELEDDDRRLLAGVEHNCRNKFVFAGSWADSQRPMVRHLFIDEIDPLKVKWQGRRLELEPHETTRVTRTHTTAEGVALAWPTVTTEGTSSGTTKSRGEQVDFSLQRDHTKSVTDTHGRAVSVAKGRHGARVISHADAVHDAESALDSESEVAGAVLSPDALEPTVTSSTVIGIVRGAQEGRSSIDGIAELEGESEVKSDSVSDARAEQRGSREGVSVRFGASAQDGEQQSSNETHSRGVTPSISRQTSTSEAVVPFHEYEKRYVPEAPVYWTIEEQEHVFLQRIQAQPVGHFAAKIVGEKQTLFMRAPSVCVPWVSRQALLRLRDRLRSLPFYRRAEDIDEDERLRRTQCLELESETTSVGTPARAKKRERERERDYSF